MKAKVIIENGKTQIVLTPENRFEMNIIETAADNGHEKYTISATISANYSYGSYTDHKIVCELRNVEP